MGLLDSFHFDDKAYTIKVKNTLNSRILRKKHHSKIRLRQASAFSVGWGIGLAPATLGVSLFGSIYSLRQIDVLSQQATLIEVELNSRGLETPRCRKRDFVYGVLIGVTGVCIGIGIGEFFGLLIDPMTGGIASVTGTVGVHELPSTMDAAQSAASNFPSAAHGALQGANHVLWTELHHVNHDINAYAAPVSPAGNAAFRGGEQLAVAAMDAGQRVTASAAGQAILENRIFNAEHPRRNCE